MCGTIHAWHAGMEAAKAVHAYYFDMNFIDLFKMQHTPAHTLKSTETIHRK